MIGQDYKPEGFLKFVWEKAKDSIFFTTFTLILFIFALIMTPDMLGNNPTWLVLSLDIILFASTVANVLHPYSIWRKLKNKNK
jgi:hypothetical protein